jgi:D-sedoheptulose 7-phosphate isomerase
MGFTESYRSRLLGVLENLDLGPVDQAIAWFSDARREDRQIFVCGNGGSAATASHFVCDVLKGASYRRPERFRIQSLNDNMPTLTAYANDVSYDSAFAEQLRNFARPGDVFLAISGSGNSPSVVRAMECAREMGCRTIALTGRDGGKLGPLAELQIHVAEPHMGRIEDAHMVVCHMIAYRFMEEPEAA